MTREPTAIRLLVLDVDGVLTDGRLYFGPNAESLKVFHVRDGHGIRMLLDAGVHVGVISGRRSKMVAVRCRELGVAHVIQGVKDKVAAFERLRSKLGVAAAESACVGDDVPDIPLMKTVGLAFAVADAHADALRAADRVTSLPGGLGAVREICDYLLSSRGASRNARNQPVPLAGRFDALPPDLGRRRATGRRRTPRRAS